MPLLPNEPPPAHVFRAAYVAAAFTGMLGAGCIVGGPLGLGSTSSARLRRADLFTRDCVGVVGDRYVVCGSAERMLADEPDAELLDEARLDAEARLAASLGARGLEISTLRVAHTWTECGGRLFVANFSVPITAVGVTEARRPAISTASRSTQCPDDF